MLITVYVVSLSLCIIIGMLVLGGVYMLNFLKKQWFLSLIALLLVSTVAYYVYDQNKDNLPSKSVGGKDIVFSVAGSDVSTDDVYAQLYQQAGIDVVYMLFERAVVHASADTTDVMSTKASVDIEGVKSNFLNYYGEATYESYLLDALKSMGYSSLDDLEDYFVYTYKFQDLLNAYVDTNFDTIYPSFESTYQPRIVSHVLVKMDDPNNPTADETARFEAAKAAYASGMSFEEMVTTYSDDTSNNTNGGILGYMDTTTQYESAFLNAALALTEDGSVSEWVQTSYGYHLIRLDSSAVDQLKTYQEFYDAIVGSDATIKPNVVWEQAQAEGVDFGTNEELKAEILSYMGITEAQ